jgi:hypothetical protein
MSERFNMVKKCLHKLESCNIHPLKKLRLEMLCYQLLQVLLTLNRLPRSDANQYQLLLEQLNLVAAVPDDQKALANLEEFFLSLLAEFDGHENIQSASPGKATHQTLPADSDLKAKQISDY